MILGFCVWVLENGGSMVIKLILACQYIFLYLDLQGIYNNNDIKKSFISTSLTLIKPSLKASGKLSIDYIEWSEEQLHQIQISPIEWGK